MKKLFLSLVCFNVFIFSEFQFAKFYSLLLVNGMLKGKSSGIDGFPCELYLAIWPIISNDLDVLGGFSHWFCGGKI